MCIMNYLYSRRRGMSIENFIYNIIYKHLKTIPKAQSTSYKHVQNEEIHIPLMPYFGNFLVLLQRPFNNVHAFLNLYIFGETLYSKCTIGDFLCYFVRVYGKRRWFVIGIFLFSCFREKKDRFLTLEMVQGKLYTGISLMFLEYQKFILPWIFIWHCSYLTEDSLVLALLLFNTFLSNRVLSYVITQIIVVYVPSYTADKQALRYKHKKKKTNIIFCYFLTLKLDVVYNLQAGFVLNIRLSIFPHPFSLSRS